MSSAKKRDFRKYSFDHIEQPIADSIISGTPSFLSQVWHFSSFGRCVTLAVRHFIDEERQTASYLAGKASFRHFKLSKYSVQLSLQKGKSNVSKRASQSILCEICCAMSASRNNCMYLCWFGFSACLRHVRELRN
jgi:hypothetical protein